MMLNPQNAHAGKSAKPMLRRIFLYFSLLLLGWIILMFVVIPWDTSGSLPQGSFDLIEGQRAYAMVVRKQRPTLATTIRGLNMVGAAFTQEQREDGRSVSSGNVRLYFDNHGEFLHIEIIKEKPERRS